MRRTGQSTYKAFLTNLREVAERYYDAKGIKSFGTLHCAFIMKQYLSSLPDNVRAFVLSKQPETADQAAEYSDLFFELSRINKDNGIHGMGTQRNPGLVPSRNTGLQQNANPSFKPAQRQVGQQDGGVKGKPQFGNAGLRQIHPGVSGGGYNANETHTHTHTHTQPFNGLLSGTIRVGRYQKKHSPTHTHPDHRTSFIIFLHLQRSTASSLFSLRA